MEITEVRIKLIESAEDRLRGFCSVTFDDCFVVRDLKIIEGNNGPFVAMPSRKLTANCLKCRSKNHLRAKYCNNCGARQRQNDGIEYDNDGRAKLYADIAHPVNAECREMIQRRVVEELDREIALAKTPGYISRYDEGYDNRSKSRAAASKPRHQTQTPNPATPKTDLERVDDSHASAKPHESDVTESNSSSQSSEKTSSEPEGGFGRGVFD